MKKESSLRHQTPQGLKLKSKQKDWLTRLESVSGSPVELSQTKKRLYLLIDCSTSMADGDKMEQAKRGSLAFAEEAIHKGYIVGLITFSYSADLLLESQYETSQLHLIINNLHASGSTNLTGALHIARNQLTDMMGERILCVVTDGMPDDTTSALEMAKAIHQDGIDIMTIGTDDADKKFLRKLSTRDDLTIKVDRNHFEQGIVSMAKMLPGKDC